MARNGSIAAGAGVSRTRSSAGNPSMAAAHSMCSATLIPGRFEAEPRTAEPVEERGREARHAAQRRRNEAERRRLQPRLLVVAAVGRDARALCVDEQDAGRAGEARQPAAVRRRRDEQRVDLEGVEALAHACEAGD